MLDRRNLLRSSTGALLGIAATGPVVAASAADGSETSLTPTTDSISREGRSKAGTGFALALGGGAAKGIAHIPVLEALDEMGVVPVRIAGTSMGAIIGSCYASGMSGLEIRDYTVKLFEERMEVIRKIFSGGDSMWPSFPLLSGPAVIDPMTLLEAALPDGVAGDFSELKIPMSIIATDFHAQEEVVIEDGPLLPAIGASSALPVLMSPVSLNGRILIDGGFVNPTPFDILKGLTDFTVAVDVTGKQQGAANTVPGPLETWIGSFHITLHSLVNQKLKCEAPDVLIRPDLSRFDTMDFYKAEEILAATEPVKEEVKRKLDRLLKQKS